jgi:hypothetical protein
VRDLEPLPHDLVQLDQPSPLAAQLPTVQSSGHACVLHSSVSAACGHASPPKVACTSVRVRDLEPTPHDLVQLDQPSPLMAQLPMPQSSGHVCVLHSFVSAACGHASPPVVACTSVRVRDLEPPPHDLVQLDQPSPLSAQLPMPQSSGHVMAPQAWYSVLCGHAWPPAEGGVLSRVRDRMPPPHV